MKKVSILIPCYNASQWIEKAVSSALEQDYENKEVIVVDDGSTDDSLIKLKKFEPIVTVISTPNHGGNKARNRLLAEATGEWIQYLDADDYLFPSKVSRQMASLTESDQPDVFFSPSLIRFESSIGEPDIKISDIPEPHDPWILLARWYLPQTGACLWNRKSLLLVGGWKESQKACQEHELYLRALIAGLRFKYVDDAGSVYRQWSENTVCKRDKRLVYTLRMEIEDILETHLREQKILTSERLWAINMARFEMARMSYSNYNDLFLNLKRKINISMPKFIPNGNASPRFYLMIYNILGMNIAEFIAKILRKMNLKLYS